jgi:hypothetical protein
VVWVSVTGVFQPDFTTDTSDDFGGVEAIDPVTYGSDGIVIDDASIGGYPFGIQIVSPNLAFTTADSKRVVSFDPSDLSVTDSNVYQSPGTFLPEILFDGAHHLLIAERGDLDGLGAGLVLLDLDNKLHPQGPLDVGGPPNSLAVVELP